jgi:2-haloacid dehalogenase
MPNFVVFNLNGTLVDLGGLDPLFHELTGDASLRKRWFHEVVKHMLISATTTVYHAFDDIADAALSTVEFLSSRSISAADRLRFLQQLQSVPAFPDVVPALDRLNSAGYRLVVFTNGALATAQKQLQNAGISKYFVAVHSADEVQRYKPAIEAYQFLAKKLNAGVSEITMVAAHDWDISGASWAGYQTVFIQRELPLTSITPEPTYSVRSLTELTGILAPAKAA